jgi:hypothetical protein
MVQAEYKVMRKIQGLSARNGNPVCPVILEYGAALSAAWSEHVTRCQACRARAGIRSESES